MSEAWRPVPGYPNYSISDRGRVRFDGCRLDVSDSRGRVYSRWMKPRILRASKPTARHYSQVGIYGTAGRLHVAVHRLVLEAFVGPRPDRAHTRHLDGDRSNNRLSNLRYGTIEENFADKKLHGTHTCGERCGTSKLKPAEIPIIRGLKACGISQAEIARRFGVAPMTISRVVRGHRWTHVRSRSSEGEVDG
jgi:hypothetical protein